MATLAAILAVTLPLHPAVDPDAGNVPSLFAQTAQSTLDRKFPSDSISYLLLDAQSGSVIAERWASPNEPVPVGSLIKPFTALAYARTHRPFPAVVCSGQRDSCWLPRGHGHLTLSEAIAQSCNAYFLALTRELSVDQANEVLTAFSLPPVTAANKSAALVGLSNDWRVAPLSLARAYAALAHEAHVHDPAIIAGMQGSAKTGTAHAISLALPGRSALAKTGTASCTHMPRASADGFTIVLYPADDPRVVLLTRKHAVTGAATAATAAQMLLALEGGQ